MAEAMFRGGYRVKKYWRKPNQKALSEKEKRLQSNKYESVMHPENH
jgi:hypothetical protein